MPRISMSFDAQNQRFISDVKELEAFCSDEEIAETLMDSYFCEFPKGDIKKEFLVGLIRSNRREAEENEKEIRLYSNELQFLLSLDDNKARLLYYLLLCWERLYPCEKEYIKFDFVNMMKLAKEVPFAKNIKREDIQCLLPYGIEFRCIGSQNPIVCYKLSDIENDETDYVSFKRGDIGSFFVDRLEEK